jgi:nonribosomal peptide synthetase DhbF
LRTISEVIAEYQLPRIDLLKIDCEGAEWEVLRGIAAADWPKIQQVVVEVHDHDGRADQVRALLSSHGFSSIVAEKEKALEGTDLVNMFAIR